VSPREDGRRRPFGKTAKKVVIHGETFKSTYVMDKVLIRETKKLQADREKEAKKSGFDAAQPRAKVHGPHMGNFEYAKLLPKKVNGRWKPGPWLPLIPKEQLAMCSSGYHVTTMKFRKQWGSDNPGAHVYLVECAGPLTAPKSTRPAHISFRYGDRAPAEASKYVFRSIRLLRLVG
jgi:hypothetical protein